MGGCASRPAEFNVKPDAAPVEVEAQKPAPETTNDGGEIETETETAKEKEEPLVDIAETNPTADAESPVAQEPASAIADSVDEKKVEATTAVEAKSPEILEKFSDKKETEPAKTDAPLITI
ncbi:hypothetical protein SAY87_009927 [Trapa incisa]|uniref:Uncharacterized protein n=1 Tax=Trapa incisa TaxID=236973 RepID=A0AAN7GDG1_9MYRT|nr:hypothetical protein SAY87_009927 [Trapa incisa]